MYMSKKLSGRNSKNIDIVGAKGLGKTKSVWFIAVVKFIFQLWALSYC